jgi:hypothetical protein
MLVIWSVSEIGRICFSLSDVLPQQMLSLALSHTHTHLYLPFGLRTSDSISVRGANLSRLKPIQIANRSSRYRPPPPSLIVATTTTATSAAVSTNDGSTILRPVLNFWICYSYVPPRKLLPLLRATTVRGTYS